MSDEPKKVNGVSESPVSEYLDHLMKELAKALVLKAIIKAIGTPASAGFPDGFWRGGGSFAGEPERPKESDGRNYKNGDTTLLRSDHAQRLRAGLAELEREHVANNPRVIVQPDYPDWDDGEY